MTDIEETAIDSIDAAPIDTADDLALVKKMQDGRDQIVAEIQEVTV